MASRSLPCRKFREVRSALVRIPANVTAVSGQHGRTAPHRTAPHRTAPHRVAALDMGARREPALVAHVRLEAVKLASERVAGSELDENGQQLAQGRVNLRRMTLDAHSASAARQVLGDEPLK